MAKLVAVLALVALAGGCGGGTPRRSGAIVASRLADGLALYRMNADGSGMKRLSPPNASDSQPAWSPDGRTITFVRETIYGPRLCAMDATSGRVHVLHVLGDAFANPSWSPSGDHIAYAAIDAIAILDIHTRTVARISHGYDAHPSWSPDGKEIAFEHDASGNGDTSVWVMRADGTRRRRVSHPHGSEADHEPAWSPDGKRIAFHRDYDLWLVDVRSGSERRIARFADYPSWSPDGLRILVTEVRRPISKTGLYAVDPKTGRSKLVVRGFWTESTWQPLSAS